VPDAIRRIPIKFRIDKILIGKPDPKTGNLEGGFETLADAEKEDVERVRLIQRTVPASSRRVPSPKPHKHGPAFPPSTRRRLKLSGRNWNSPEHRRTAPDPSVIPTPAGHPADGNRGDLKGNAQDPG